GGGSGGRLLPGGVARPAPTRHASGHFLVRPRSRLRCPAMPMRALIFDFNGTLSDDEHVMEAVARNVFSRYGPAPTHDEYVERLAGLSDEAMVRTWLGDRDDVEMI